MIILALQSGWQHGSINQTRVVQSFEDMRRALRPGRLVPPLSGTAAY